ncbi:ATP-binding protein [Vibrio penaeicida]|uniref:hybrid sensor histidine kinase/response regulator n=1 Tax=Vibrio penaeicida TaxID=104609 RepID=UPI00273341B4|nr:hybrid sensor histidine kinase/response regulator [Vibrio penaeicida]MDP2570995.1 ATP-binding protein [Vibrio penaeicida]
MSYFITKWQMISGKITIAMVAIAAIVVTKAILSFQLYSQVQENNATISRQNIPGELAAVNMLDEIGDMNADMLHYILGDATRAESFDKNREQFFHYLDVIEKSESIDINTVQELGSLFFQFENRVKLDIFSSYNPNDEIWARSQVNSLVNTTGQSLLNLAEKVQKLESNAHSSKLSLQSDEFFELINDLNQQLRVYVLGAQGVKEEFSTYIQRAEFLLTWLKYLLNEPSSHELIETLRAELRVMRNGGFEVFERYNNNDKQGVLKIAEEVTGQEYKQLSDTIGLLSARLDSQMTERLTVLDNLTNNYNYFLFGSIFAVLVFCTVVTIYIYRSISAPLLTINQQMKSLIKGDTSIKVPYRYRSDEVGEMARMLEAFRQNQIERNQYQQEVIIARDNAESATKAKANFLATMSHEIRTPMNGIIGMIDLLNTTRVNREQQRMLKTVRESSFSLLNIINDILDFSKIEAGKLDVEQTTLPLRETLENVVATLSPSAENAGIVFQLYIDPELPEEVLGDPVRLRQILFNIIGNAIKFSSKLSRRGEVSLEVHAYFIDINEITIQFDIKDNGIGIHQDQISTLFTPFTQAESDTTRRFGGTGLGLSISKHLTELMGGEISVNSTFGIGTTFSIHLTFPFSQDPSNRVNPVHIAETQVYVDLSTDWLNSHLPSYLKTLCVPWKKLDRHLFPSLKLTDPHCIIITDSLADLVAIEPEALHDSIKYLELLPHANISSQISERTFSISAQPLKLSNLRYGLRVVTGMESPFDIAPHTEEQMEFKELSAGESKGLILVAEDNPVNQEVIRKQLKALGYECKLADEGLQAQTIYEQYDFDLVLTDCHMPECDGYELTSALRQKQIEKGRRIPIIAVTANAMIGEAKKCLTAGMDDYLPKPIELEKLKRMLHDWMPSSDTATSSGVAMNLEVVDTIFGGDMNAYKQSVNDFMQLSLPQYQALADVESEEFEMSVVANIAHKLKSSASTIGLDELYKLTQEIENHSKLGAKPELLNTLAQLKALLPKIEALINSQNSEA